ncbi:hypothetical protein [Nonomuraea sp. NPDC050310]|uniref:hypothetical protein n=1 Tax=Nonomuraea sp. NPDC050310 TaxID=3154935 RepID=UPI0033FCC759
MSDVRLGRLLLRETFGLSEQPGQLELSGKEVVPLITRDDLLDRHDHVIGSPGGLVAAVWDEKSERNGYYTIRSASSDYLDRKAQGIAWINWKLSLVRHGSDTDVDLESRLSGAVRANDFALAGERWSAPPIGHYAYYTGSTSPTILTRASADGTITVYRGVPSGVSPRWGCAVDDWLRGRVRILTLGTERVGVSHNLATDHWELSNALVRVRPLSSGGSLEIASFTSGLWRPKAWWVDIGGVQVTSWESASILRNDLEQGIVRLTASRSPVGRVVLDLTLRRGSRFVEGHLQRGDSGALSFYLANAETMTDATSYVVKTTNDADGNRAIAGSPRNFDPHASGGLTRTASTSLTFFAGVVAGGGSAVAGDQATHLRDQFIGALPEITAAVRR